MPLKTKKIIERNLSFEEVVEFDFEGARLSIDERKDYGEIRIRVISFRKANKRELTEYEKQIQN